MTAALEGGEWSTARPGRTLPPGKTRYPFYRRLGGPQGRSGRAENFVPTGIRSRTVQPVVSRYTDWVIFISCTLQQILDHVIWNNKLGLKFICVSVHYITTYIKCLLKRRVANTTETDKCKDKKITRRPTKCKWLKKQARCRREWGKFWNVESGNPWKYIYIYIVPVHRHIICGTPCLRPLRESPLARNWFS